MVVKTFGQALNIYSRDKKVIALSLIPVIIGLVLYSFVGAWLLSDLKVMIHTWLGQWIDLESYGTVLSWFLTFFLTVGTFLLVNWTFVLVVSIVASPFNDFVCGQVKKIILGIETDDSAPFSFMNILKVVFNELKKVIVITIVSLIAVIIGLFPAFAPLSFVLSALLITITFVDYSWSREELKLSECINDVLSTPISYLLAGMAFSALLVIPIVNVLAYSFGVTYFSVMYYNKKRVS